MKNIPKKIYLQVDPDNQEPKDFKELKGVTFSEDQINHNDIEYYRADLVQNIVNFFANNYIPKKFIEEHMNLIKGK